MTERMVSVPVEPTEAMLLAGALVGPDTNNGEFSYDDARTVFAAMLTAAPVREEGGAVSGPGGYLVKDFADGWYWTPNAALDHASGAPVWSVADNRYETDPPALATREEAPDWTARTEAAWAENNREEAPAEAGETVEKRFSELNDDLIRMASTGSTGSLAEWGAFIERLKSALRAQPQDRIIGVLAEAVHDRMFGVASLHDPALALTEISDGGGLHEAVHELIRSLPPRVGDQSQAREDAQPVAWVDPYVLHRLAEYLGGVIYPRQGRGARQPLYTRPAPDALRVAVEALDEMADTDPDDGTAWFHNRIERARRDLAALQAEQGAK